MTEQNTLNLEEVGSVDMYKFEPIKGYPMLHWHGKRPFTSTQYYPAQKKEIYGAEVSGWLNKIYWGDNLQVMSHLLKKFRSKVELIYIDPPFDSNADYKKRIKLKGKKYEGDISSFEEKQYTDIWTNDEYLQFMYERICLCRELLSPTGKLFLHLDYRQSHKLRCILDEIFGSDNFRNEIIWHYGQRTMPSNKAHPKKHDNILFYAKSGKAEIEPLRVPWTHEEVIRMQKQEVHLDENGDDYFLADGGAGNPRYRRYVKDIVEAGKLIDDVWDIPILTSSAKERTPYPTQKPEELIERIISSACNEGDLVFDCFMGSGTTQAVSQKLGRRFIGADINLGSVQITAKRILELIKSHESQADYRACGFEVLSVNNYDVFRNPVEAVSLLMEALEIEKLAGTVYDGEKDGWMVKVMPVNRIATREDLNDLIAGLPYKVFESRKAESPGKAVESIMLICMGHEPDLRAHLERESGYKLNVSVVDILRDKSNIQFKREAEADICTANKKLSVKNFYPMNLMQKLSLQKESVAEWRELVDSLMIDWNFDGAIMEPSIVDVPSRNEQVLGVYDIPEGAGTIKIKITDLLSESYEEVINHG